MGGDSNKEYPMDPALAQIVNHVKERLDAGENPQAIVVSLIQQNIPQEAISGALEQIGYGPADVVALFQSLQPQQQFAGPDNENQEQQDNYSDNENQEQLQPEMQYGGTSKGYLQSRVNPNIPKPNYLPLIPEQGNIFGAAAVLDDTIGSLFSGKQDESGLMSGAFRDMKAKKARWREKKPQYYKYDVTRDPNDTNEYVNDPNDLYKGKLRTKEQYTEDVLKNSRLDFNTKTGKYEGYITPNEINNNLLGKKQVDPMKDFKKKSVSFKDFMKRLDANTAGLLQGVGDDPMGTTLGISPDGVASSYRDAASNPDYYNTMMGLNLYKPTQDKPQDKPLNKPFSIYEYGMNPNIQSMIPTKKHGGQLPKAQNGINIDEPMTFDEWTNMNGRGASGMEYQDQMDYEKYKKSFGTTNMVDPNTPVTAIEPIDTYGGYQKFIDDSSVENENGLLQIPNDGNVSYNPKVKKSTNFTSWMSNQLDRPGVNAFGKAATAGVGIANVANEMFKQGRFNAYDDKLRQATMADKVFATTKNPVNARGMWDVNSGLAEPDMYVPYLQAAQYGGAQETEEFDVDNETLMNLIAAGADIQIL